MRQTQRQNARNGLASRKTVTAHRYQLADFLEEIKGRNIFLKNCMLLVTAGVHAVRLCGFVSLSKSALHISKSQLQETVPSHMSVDMRSTCLSRRKRHWCHVI